MSDQNHDCCPPTESEESVKSQESCSPGSCALPPAKRGGGGKRTIWASLGLGVLAAACCWVPLALAGAGLATGTLGAKVAWIRPWALGGLMLLLLGLLGWWARRRFAPAKTAEGCCEEVPKFPTLAVTILLGSFGLAWGAPRILYPGRNTAITAMAPPAPAGGTLLLLSTPQYDCPPCAGSLPQTLAATPGVASVQMDFEKRETRIIFQPGAAIDPAMDKWKKDLGFDGKVIRREAAPAPIKADVGIR